MRLDKKTRLAGILLGATLALSFAAPRARAADTEDDKKKAEKDLKKAEENQGKEKKPQGQGALDGEENPLPKIMELMRQVEERLAESDTGSITQEEQKKIVEALKFGGQAKSALDELIKKIEDMQQQSEQQSGEQSEEQKKQQQKDQQQKPDPNETPEQKKERERKEREKQEREKREEEKRKLQQQQPKDQQQKKQPKDDKKQKNDKKESGRPPPDDQGKLDPRQRPGGQWGNLPAKLHGDAEKARSENVPERFREQIERYRKAVQND